MGSECNCHQKQAFSTVQPQPKISSTKGLFVMAIAPTSHQKFLTTIAFLECFYMVLINKKQILKVSEAFFFHPYYLKVKILKRPAYFCLLTQRKSKTSFPYSHSPKDSESGFAFQDFQNFQNSAHPNVERAQKAEGSLFSIKPIHFKIFKYQYTSKC